MRFEKAATSVILSCLGALGAPVPLKYLKSFDDSWTDTLHDRIVAVLAGRSYDEADGT